METIRQKKKQELIKAFNLFVKLFTAYLEKQQAVYDEWKEEKHKRDKNGRFAKSGSCNNAVTVNKNEKQVAISEKIKNTYSSITDIKKKSAVDTFGKNYYNLKGKPEKAIAMLLHERKGYVGGAFHRDGFGDIDLVWGNQNKGIKHAEKRRIKTNQDFMNLMENLPDIIEKGKIENDLKGDKNTKIFIYNDLQAVVPMVQYIDKKGIVQRNWVLTLYEKYDE